MLLISQVNLNVSYQHTLSGTMCLGNALIRGTRSIAVNIYNSSTIDIISFDEINPKNCLAFKDTYS